MARKPRIHIPGGLYHVILRGNGGQPVFLSDEDRYRFYLLLQEGTCRFGYRVHAFCLMTNHIHLVLQAGSIPLSLGMQNLSFRYTRWVNLREKRMGHLFQGRFKSVLVDGDSYLLELIRYIHLNPVRAGMVDSPGKYRWSSHFAYLGKELLPWLTTDWMFSQFGKTLTKARAGYKSFILDGMKEERRPEFYGGKEDSRVLGDDGFVDNCLASLGDIPIRLTVEEIIDRVGSSYNIEVATLQSKSQQRTTSEARAVVGWLAREFDCATLSEVGRHFSRDVGSISSAVRRLAARMGGEPDLTARVQSLKKHLLNKVNILEA